MKLKTKARLAMGAFLVACLVPSVGMLIVPERPAAANQRLAQPPSLTQKDGSFNPEVFQEAADYIADHFAFRQELITADAVLNAAVLGVSAEEDVTLGRDGWLFYTETIDGYLHTAPLTQRQLWAGAHTLALVQEYVQARGARLLFTAAPNKASLYPQYLPDVGTPLEGADDIDRLRPLLEAEGVPYADLFAPFRAREDTLYFSADSHWNAQGAELACQTLLTALDRPCVQDTTGGPVMELRRGDLYQMLYPTGTDRLSDLCFEQPSFHHIRQPRGPDDQRIETENPDLEGSLLMFRDSFGNNLYPLMAQQFGRALFSRSMPLQLSLLEQSGADTVIVELVERNLDYLAVYAPIFPAPERLLTGTPPQGLGQGQFSLSSQHPLEGYLRLEGLLPQADNSSPIYIQLGKALYEASPAGGEWDKGIPFTLYVPQGTDLESACAICVQQGTLCILPLEHI